MTRLRPSSLVCTGVARSRLISQQQLSRLPRVQSEADCAGCRAGRKRARPGRWRGGTRRGRLASPRLTSQRCGAKRPHRWPLQVRLSAAVTENGAAVVSSLCTVTLSRRSSSTLARTASGSAGPVGRVLWCLALCMFHQAAEHIAQCMRGNCILWTTALQMLQHRTSKVLFRLQARPRSWQALYSPCPSARVSAQIHCRLIKSSPIIQVWMFAGDTGAAGKGKENPPQAVPKAPSLAGIIKPLPGHSRFNTGLEANPLAALNPKCASN